MFFNYLLTTRLILLLLVIPLCAFAQEPAKDRISTPEGAEAYQGAELASGTSGLAYAEPDHAITITADRLQNIAYSVVAIHPVKNYTPERVFCSFSGGRNGNLRSNCVTVQTLIAMAWGVEPSLVLGGPGWIKSERYTLDARTDDDLARILNTVDRGTNQKIQAQLLQSMLAERFHLKLHQESRPMPVLFLDVSKKGLKMQEAASFAEAHDKNGNTQNLGSNKHYGYGQFTAERVRIKELITYLELQYQQVIIDRTNLAGAYNFKLSWTPDEAKTDAKSAFAPENQSPTLSVALEEQLGLKLTTGKAPVHVLVIDNVGKPSEN